MNEKKKICQLFISTDKIVEWMKHVTQFISLFLSKAERFDIPPYEEMALYYPQANQRRPLILVGPPSIGRHELRLRLLEDTSRFNAAVPRKQYMLHYFIIY